MSHVQISPNDPPNGTLLTVPHDAPSLSPTVPHDGPRYPYDGAGDSDKPWLMQAGEISILGSRHTVHSTPLIICNMGRGQHRLLLLHFNSQTDAMVMKKIGT